MYVGWCRTWMEVPRTSLPTRGNTFQIRGHLALSSLRFASCASSERSEGSLSGERSFAALRMTLLKRLGLTRKTSSLKCIAHKGSHSAQHHPYANPVPLSFSL